jgi:hypothetical protein
MSDQVLVQSRFLPDHRKNTSNYSSFDWERITGSLTFITYTVDPRTQEPQDKPSESYTYEVRGQQTSWDEVMEQVLTDRARAWDELADL